MCNYGSCQNRLFSFSYFFQICLQIKFYKPVDLANFHYKLLRFELKPALKLIIPLSCCSLISRYQNFKRFSKATNIEELPTILDLNAFLQFKFTVK